VTLAKDCFKSKCGSTLTKDQDILADHIKEKCAKRKFRFARDVDVISHGPGGEKGDDDDDDKTPKTERIIAHGPGGEKDDDDDDKTTKDDDKATKPTS
jgi:hypothetical protein